MRPPVRIAPDRRTGLPFGFAHHFRIRPQRRNAVGGGNREDRHRDVHLPCAEQHAPQQAVHEHEARASALEPILRLDDNRLPRKNLAVPRPVLGNKHGGLFLIPRKQPPYAIGLGHAVDARVERHERGDCLGGRMVGIVCHAIVGQRCRRLPQQKTDEKRQAQSHKSDPAVISPPIDAL